MNEKDLNIEYICEKTLLNKDDELVPIILSLIQESYKAGLCQAEFDNTMNLIEENQELKQKYLNAVADYETTMFEKEQLNSLVNSCQEEIRQLKKQLEVGNEQYNDLVEEKEILQEQLSIKTLQLEELKSSKRDYTQENILEMKMFKLQTQQKKFIKYLEDEIKKQKPEETKKVQDRNKERARKLGR